MGKYIVLYIVRIMKNWKVKTCLSSQRNAILKKKLINRCTSSEILFEIHLKLTSVMFLRRRIVLSTVPFGGLQRMRSSIEIAGYYTMRECAWRKHIEFGS